MPQTSKIFHSTVHPGQLAVHGPLIQVTISLPTQIQQLRGSNPQVTVWALIDTGASVTFISPNITKQLELVSTGSMNCRNAGGTRMSNEYSVNFTFPGSGIIFADWPVLDFALTGQPFEVLIGRDVLFNALFVYRGTTGEIGLEVKGETDVFSQPPFKAATVAPHLQAPSQSPHPVLNRAARRKKNRNRTQKHDH